MQNLSSKAVAVMLAGGKGSRLHELTIDTCTPAVPFAADRRIVDWTLDNFAQWSPDHVLVATQYRPEALVDHIQTSWRKAFRAGGLSIRNGALVTGGAQGYAGTADTVTQNIAQIDACAPETVLIIAADHVYSTDYARMLMAHHASGRPVTVAVDRAPLDQARAFGVMATDANGMVIEFVEKPAHPKPMPGDPAMALVSMGIYALDWQWLRAALLTGFGTPAAALDFGHDILPRAVMRGEVYAYDVVAHEEGFFWRDVGTLEALRETCIAISRGDLPCNVQTTPVMPRTQRGTRILPGGTIVMPGARIAAGARLRNTIVAPDAEVPNDRVTAINLPHDARHFRVTSGGTVLITSQMLARRRADLVARRGAAPIPSKIRA